MAALRRHHHELIVQYYIRTGGNAAEAYRLASKKCIGKPLNHPKSPAVCAGRILAYPEVKARLAELQAQMAKRADITVDKILSEYQRALNMAESLEKPADRVEAGSVGDFDKMDNISDIIEAVAMEAGPEAAQALMKAFGLSGIADADKATSDALIENPEGDIEAEADTDLAGVTPASNAVN